MTELADLPLFATPTAAPASLAVRYRAWRATAEGAEVSQLVARYALEQLAAGNGRISINQLFEAVRAVRRKHVNNSWRAFLARELLAAHPELEGRIEVRKRKRGM